MTDQVMSTFLSERAKGQAGCNEGTPCMAKQIGISLDILCHFLVMEIRCPSELHAILEMGTTQGECLYTGGMEWL